MATTNNSTHPMATANSIDSNRIDKEPRLTHATTNISLSPELFEKLYLAPKTPHANERAGQYANATPLGFLGFLISTFTFSMILMGWGGANGLQAVVGIFFFTGPVLLVLSTIFLWIANQFFTMMVCGLFSVFWLSFGMLQLPTLGLAASYSSTGDAAEGAAGGALLFVVGLLGWYMLFVIMAAEMRWSVCPPVGDLSHYWARTDVEIGAMASEKKD
ncbi:plasma membrane ammonium transporter (Ato3) [Stemphylium lycopersici]|uniref:Plasma membrane ammonium transporter (Ato3) n=1 Tax=Stemphylium lycopersici TaxID=183478 RepID=A0A364MTM5_STELY|nr:plasma membrane ammonium transporter (Ato3) [Stemphylium lycopersici]RAR03213.1 plasma membrane ammonium transporter (Ato3) [Stemphylium lycopersici]